MIKFLFLIPFVFVACQSVQSSDSGKNKWAGSEAVSAELGSVNSEITPCDTVLIKKHLVQLTKDEIYRNYKNIERLDSVAAYIYRSFSKHADTVYYQEFYVKDKIYRNVVCSFGTNNNAHIVVGAHYDVCGEQEGADDNASGVVGLLELARMLEGHSLTNQIDLVAYTLEEPPFFRSTSMGSYQHAKSLVENKVDVRGMICLEMIGYFSDEKQSQTYPVEGMEALYGNAADYISIVSKSSPGKFISGFTKQFMDAGTVKTKHIAASASVQGIDFSDHLNYWNLGFSALMITDTAFYRNDNYHESSDVMETLDIQRMSHVIEAVFIALTKVA